MPLSAYIFQFKKFLDYWLNAVTEHSIHSPFFFDFYINIIKQKNDSELQNDFEELREKLTKDQRLISVVDLGAGSRRLTGKNRKISALAKTSLTPAKFSKLYNLIINHYKLEQIVELGTSLGINTLYLSATTNSTITTFEGSPEIAAIARSNFERFHVKNITLCEGDIDTTLPGFINSSGKLDFIFLDANHRYEPTIRYFQYFIQRIHRNSVVILDDIHYSEEMDRAWNEIRRDKHVYGSIDLYRCGILFFDPSLNRQHIIMQF